MAGTCVYQYTRTARGVLRQRYKRFLADVEIEGDSNDTVCHCPNTGPMTGLLGRQDAPVLLSVHDNSKRKYKHTLEMVQPEAYGAWVGVHSAKANAFVGEVLRKQLLPQLGEISSLTSEVNISTFLREDGAQAGSGTKRKRAASPDSARKAAPKTRVDYMIAHPDGTRTFVEVKSVTLADGTAAAGRLALFPDTVSTRAQRHMADLMRLAAQGFKAVCIYAVQRSDCDAFSPCWSSDADYARLVAQAEAVGVTLLALRFRLDPDSASVVFECSLPVAVSADVPTRTASADSAPVTTR